MKILLSVFAVFLIVGLSACGGGDGDLQALREEIASLQAENSNLRIEIIRLQNQIESGVASSGQSELYGEWRIQLEGFSPTFAVFYFAGDAFTLTHWANRDAQGRYYGGWDGLGIPLTSIGAYFTSHPGAAAASGIRLIHTGTFAITNNTIELSFPHAQIAALNFSKTQNQITIAQYLFFTTTNSSN